MPPLDEPFAVEFYEESDGTKPVREDIERLSRSNVILAAHVIAALDKLPNSQYLRRHTKPIGDGLFEWRIVNSDDARIVFFHGGRRQLVIVHVFVKKRQKLPKREREIALGRMKRWRERQEPRQGGGRSRR